MKLTHTKHVKLHDGQKMPVLIVGRGQPVILLHGFGMDARLWLPFVLPFAGRYQFYLPFLRGFGKASKVKFSQSDFMADFVQDIQAMRQQLHLPSVLLGGISMGAMTSLKLHEAGGFDGVQRYLHIDQSPVFYNDDTWSYGVFGAAQDATLAGFAQLVDAAKSYVHLPFDQIPAPVQAQFLKVMGAFMGETVHTVSQRLLMKPLALFPSLMRRMVHPIGWSAVIHGMQGYIEQRYDFRQVLPQIHVPVTVISGAQSKLYALEGQRKLVAMLPNARHVVIEQAGHVPMFDQPRAFIKALGEFLAG